MNTSLYSLKKIYYAPLYYFKYYKVFSSESEILNAFLVIVSTKYVHYLL